MSQDQAFARPGGRWSSWASLFASSATLVCCALPALLVAIGAGAALSSLVAAVPQLVWLSEHKDGVFALSGLLMAGAGWGQWRARRAPCPTDPVLRTACLRSRRISSAVFASSTGIYAVGAWFAYIAPALIA